ncbi:MULTISPECIES: mucin-binding protein, partial [Lactobacillus]|uniref:mucin-binding protein n=1 Tax=Lactobacillus xujianguonis TaxID=2495899 RepID=UPI000FDBFA12
MLFRKNQQERQRFSIRKYTFGVVSVLLGTVVMETTGSPVFADSDVHTTVAVTGTIRDTTNVGSQEQASKEEVTSAKSTGDVEDASKTTNVGSKEVENKLADSKENNNSTDTSVMSKTEQVANKLKEISSVSAAKSTGGVKDVSETTNVDSKEVENKLADSDEAISKLSNKQLVALTNSNDRVAERSDATSTDRSVYVGKEVFPSEVEVRVTNSAGAAPPTIRAQVLNFDIRFYKGIHKGDYFYVESQDLPVELPPVFNYEINGESVPIITSERIDYTSDYYRAQDINDSSRFSLSTKNGFITKKYKYKLTFTDNVEGLENIRAKFTRTFSNQTLAVAQDMKVHQIVKINDQTVLNQEYILPAWNKTSAKTYYRSPNNDGSTSFLRMNATVWDMRELGSEEERNYSKDVKSEGILTFNGEVGGLPDGFVVKLRSKDSNPNPYIWDKVNMVGEKIPIYYVQYDKGGNSDDGTVYVTPDNMYMIVEGISSDRKEMTLRFVGDFSKPGWIVNGTMNPLLEPKEKSSKLSVKFTSAYSSAKTSNNGDPDITDEGYTQIDVSDAKGQSIVKKQKNIGGYYRYTQSEKFTAVPVSITNNDQVRKGTVIVNYVDTTGRFLKNKDEMIVAENADVGTSYNATLDRFRPQTLVNESNGESKTYRLASVGAYPIGSVGLAGNLIEDADSNDIVSSNDIEGISPSGTVMQGKRYITYVYQELKGNVNVTYKDTDGNIIKFVHNDQYIKAEGQAVAKEQPVGSSYDATSSTYKPDTITDVNGKIYQIVKEGTYQVGHVDNSGHLVSTAPMVGKVLESPQTVTYIYKYVPDEQKASVVYQDVNDPTHPVNLGQSDQLIGQAGDNINYSTADKIAEYERQGYVLVSNGFDANGTKPSFDNVKGNTQNFYVTFKHGTVPVTPDNPGTPDQPINPDNPDGPKYPSGTDQISLTKDVTRTVTYEGAGDKTPSSETDTLHFQGTGYLDKVTGKWTDVNGTELQDQTKGITWTITDGTKDEGSFNLVPTKHIDGYTSKVVTDGADDGNGNVKSYTGITHTSDNINVVVQYNPIVAEQGNLIVKFHDDTDNKDLTGIGTDTGTQDVGTQVTYNPSTDLTNLENKGYVYVSTDGNIPPSIVKGTTTITIHVKHGTVPVTPDNPGTPDQPINPNDPDPNGPKYPSGTEEASIDKTITRTVHYEGADQYTPNDVQQPVHFTAKGVLDKVTGEWITPLTWSEDQTFNGVTTPKIPGYHVVSVDKDTTDNQNVDSAKISHTGADYTVTVKYAKDIPDEQKASVVYQDVNDPTHPVNLGQSDQLIGQAGDNINYSTADKIAEYERQGYVLVSNGFDANGTKPSFDNVKGNTQNFYVTFKHGTVPVTPDNPGTP